MPCQLQYLFIFIQPITSINTSFITPMTSILFKFNQTININNKKRQIGINRHLFADHSPSVLINSKNAKKKLTHQTYPQRITEQQMHSILGSDASLKQYGDGQFRQLVEEKSKPFLYRLEETRNNIGLLDKATFSSKKFSQQPNLPQKVLKYERVVIEDVKLFSVPTVNKDRVQRPNKNPMDIGKQSSVITVEQQMEIIGKRLQISKNNLGSRLTNYDSSNIVSIFNYYSYEENDDEESTCEEKLQRHLDLCCEPSKTVQMFNVITEHLPLRLSHIKPSEASRASQTSLYFSQSKKQNSRLGSFLQSPQFPLSVEPLQQPEAFYLFFQALKGYDQIYRHFDTLVIPSADAIGVSSQGCVKVWIDADFSTAIPPCRQKIVDEQYTVICELLELIRQRLVSEEKVTSGQKKSLFNRMSKQIMEGENENEWSLGDGWKSSMTFQVVMEKLKKYSQLREMGQQLILKRIIAMVGQGGKYSFKDKSAAYRKMEGLGQGNRQKSVLHERTNVLMESFHNKPHLHKQKYDHAGRLNIQNQQSVEEQLRSSQQMVLKGQKRKISLKQKNYSQSHGYSVENRGHSFEQNSSRQSDQHHNSLQRMNIQPMQADQRQPPQSRAPISAIHGSFSNENLKKTHNSGHNNQHSPHRLLIKNSQSATHIRSSNQNRQYVPTKSIFLMMANHKNSSQSPLPAPVLKILPNANPTKNKNSERKDPSPEKRLKTVGCEGSIVEGSHFNNVESTVKNRKQTSNSMTVTRVNSQNFMSPSSEIKNLTHQQPLNNNPSPCFVTTPQKHQHQSHTYHSLEKQSFSSSIRKERNLTAIPSFDPTTTNSVNPKQNLLKFFYSNDKPLEQISSMSSRKQRVGKIIDQSFGPNSIQRGHDDHYCQGIKEWQKTQKCDIVRNNKTRKIVSHKRNIIQLSADDLSFQSSGKALQNDQEKALQNQQSKREVSEFDIVEKINLGKQSESRLMVDTGKQRHLQQKLSKADSNGVKKHPQSESYSPRQIEEPFEEGDSEKEPTHSEKSPTVSPKREESPKLKNTVSNDLNRLKPLSINQYQHHLSESIYEGTCHTPQTDQESVVVFRGLEDSLLKQGEGVGEFSKEAKLAMVKEAFSKVKDPQVEDKSKVEPLGDANDRIRLRRSNSNCSGKREQQRSSQREEQGEKDTKNNVQQPLERTLKSSKSFSSKNNQSLPHKKERNRVELLSSSGKKQSQNESQKDSDKVQVKGKRKEQLIDGKLSGSAQMVKEPEGKQIAFEFKKLLFEMQASPSSQLTASLPGNFYETNIEVGEFESMTHRQKTSSSSSVSVISPIYLDFEEIKEEEELSSENDRASLEVV